MVTVHWECLFVHREKGLFSVNLREPTSFLDHGCTQRQCETSEDIVVNTESYLNREFPRRKLKNFQIP